MGKAKYRRCNIDRRARCLHLLSWWYDSALMDNAVSYGKSGQRRLVDIPDEKVSSRQPFSAVGSNPEWWRKNQSLTAEAKETRAPTSYGSSLGAASSVEIAGGRRYIDLEEPVRHAQLGYAREVMRHIARMCIDARRAIEMHLAGWSVIAIANEIGCGENQARTLVDEALAHGCSYMDLCKPSWRHAESQDDGLPDDGEAPREPSEAPLTQ